jgi:nicotinamide-nucleotide amidase
LFESLSAEIIAIGSELLAPDRTDTNSLWLTEKLNRLGIEVKLKTIVGDDDARLEEAIKDAARRSKVVITTGGLGPTEDDITRKITARALGKRLLLDEVVLAEIRQRFQSFGVTMPERNSRQAMVIEDAEVLPNPNGTRPGMFLDQRGTATWPPPGPPMGGSIWSTWANALPDKDQRQHQVASMMNFMRDIPWLTRK